MSYSIPTHLTSLSLDEALASQKKYGYNKINTIQKTIWIILLLDILKEPKLLSLFSLVAKLP